MAFRGLVERQEAAALLFFFGVCACISLGRAVRVCTENNAIQNFVCTGGVYRSAGDVSIDLLSGSPSWNSYVYQVNGDLLLSGTLSMTDSSLNVTGSIIQTYGGGFVAPGISVTAGNVMISDQGYFGINDATFTVAGNWTESCASHVPDTAVSAATSITAANVTLCARITINLGSTDVPPVQFTLFHSQSQSGRYNITEANGGTCTLAPSLTYTPTATTVNVVCGAAPPPPPPPPPIAGFHCFTGNTNRDGTLNGTEVACASSDDKCVTCFISADNPNNLAKPPYDAHTYGCGTDAKAQLLKGLGANDCWTCSGSDCSTNSLTQQGAAGANFPELVLALALVLVWCAV